MPDVGRSADNAISIHAPREGSDAVDVVLSGVDNLHFYPRSPRGERPAALAPAGRYGISIHAPREGSDFWSR